MRLCSQHVKCIDAVFTLSNRSNSAWFLSIANRCKQGNKECDFFLCIKSTSANFQPFHTFSSFLCAIQVICLLCAHFSFGIHIVQLFASNSIFVKLPLPLLLLLFYTLPISLWTPSKQQSNIICSAPPRFCVVFVIFFSSSKLSSNMSNELLLFIASWVSCVSLLTERMDASFSTDIHATARCGKTLHFAFSAWISLSLFIQNQQQSFLLNVIDKQN